MTKTYDESFKHECIQQVVKKDKTVKEVQTTFNLGQRTLNSTRVRYHYQEKGQKLTINNYLKS